MPYLSAFIIVNEYAIKMINLYFFFSLSIVELHFLGNWAIGRTSELIVSVLYAVQKWSH